MSTEGLHAALDSLSPAARVLANEAILFATEARNLANGDGAPAMRADINQLIVADIGVAQVYATLAAAVHCADKGDI